MAKNTHVCLYDVHVTPQDERYCFYWPSACLNAQLTGVFSCVKRKYFFMSIFAYHNGGIMLSVIKIQVPFRASPKNLNWNVENLCFFSGIFG